MMFKSGNFVKSLTRDMVTVIFSVINKEFCKEFNSGYGHSHFLSDK